MPAAPLYDPASAKPAYQLRYSWIGWTSRGDFPTEAAELLPSIVPLWEDDGMRPLEHRFSGGLIQVLFSARPEVSPQRVAARAKGRLDHAARQRGLKLSFSRKLAVRSVGDNSRRDIDAYLERQVLKERLIDPRFEALLEQLAFQDPSVDLSKPDESARGRYWYNLHLVLVAEERYRFAEDVLRAMRDAALKIATKKGHRVSRMAVMPDHLHLALRPLPAESPIDVAGAYQNNLAYMLKSGRLWRESFYVGTFGEYAMQAVRNAAAR